MGRFEECKKELDSLKGSGIENIVNAACMILGNPMVIHDTAYILLANTDGVNTDDRLWNELMEHKTFLHESVDFFIRGEYVLQVAESNVVFKMTSDQLKYSRITGKLFDNDGVQIGNVTVVECYKPFENGDMELIEHLSEILSTELRESKFYDKIERIFQRPLTSHISNQGKENCAIEKLLGISSDELRTSLYVAVADTSQYEKSNTHLGYFSTLFRRLHPEYQYFIHLNNIVMVISTDKEHLSIQGDLGKLSNFFQTYGIYMGISCMFYDLNEIKDRFREALNALNYGLRSGICRQIFRYEYFKAEYFLHSSVTVPEELCCPIVLSMQEYDRQHDTALYDTCYTYLLHCKDSSMASNALGVSTEEFSHSLNELNKQFEIDWNDGNVLFSIFISMKLLDDRK